MKKNRQRALFHGGKTDMYVILSFVILSFVGVGAFLYFSIFGTPPLKTDEVMTKIFESASRTKSYSADIHVQPSPEFFVRDSFGGAIQWDVQKNVSKGTFRVPLAAGIEPIAVSVDRYSEKGESLARFSAPDGSGASFFAFPEQWTKLDASSADNEAYVLIKKSLADRNVLEIITEGKGKFIPQNGVLTQMTDKGKMVHLVLRVRPDIAEKETDKESYFANLLSDVDIHIWADSETYAISEIDYSVRGYTVTAEIGKIDEALNISAPAPVISYGDWEAKFFEGLVPGHISEILIGSYGKIDQAYLSGIQKALQKATGAKVTIQKSADTLEKKNSLFDPATNRWNTERILKGIKIASAPYGIERISLYVINEQLFTPISPEERVWSRGEIGSNAAVMSVYGLNDGAPNSPAPSVVAVARAQKIALHAVGENLGFDYSPSSRDAKCVMSPQTSVAAVDVQGSGFCSSERAYLSRIFK